jgi:hypothetical protein
MRDPIAADAIRFEEALLADPNTVRSRRWASDLFSSHAALKSAVQEMYGDRLKECFGSQASKILSDAFETISALVDASGRDTSESLRLRFHCPAWMAQQFKSRILFPKDADEEERKRIRASLARQWGRTGWPPLHLMQCATGLSFFRRNVVPFDVNRRREAAVFENEYTDLLLDVRRRALAFRSKHTVWRYERAAREALSAYVSREDFRHYAPDWRPDLKEGAERATTPADSDDADENSPTVKIEAIALRAASRAAKIAAPLPAEEGDACAVLFFERLADTWEKETGRGFPLVPPVIRREDNENPSDSTSRDSVPAERREYPAKNEDLPSPPQDNLSRVEVSEFEAEAEPRGQSIAEAEATATACALVGVGKMLVVFVDDTADNFEQGCTFSEYVTPSAFNNKLPGYLERNRLSPVESMTVRIRFKDNFRLLQLDDCPPVALDTLSPLSFLQLATSPGNGQSWLALGDELNEAGYSELRYRLFTTGPLGKLGVNGGAHGSVRWPGSLNRKPNRRYADGESPRVQLLRAAPGRVVTVADLEAAGLLGAKPKKATPAQVASIKSRLPLEGWPDINDYLARNDDRSNPECSWAMRAISLGFPQQWVIEKLLEVGPKARERGRDYAKLTVSRASEFVGVSARESHKGGASKR